ncbi:MAG: chorismate mutase [Gaiellaceae bacterium]
MSELEQLRAEVAAADRAILAAVNRRLELVREIKAHKERNGIGFVDPDQERRLIEALQRENPGPLSEARVRELFERILELVKREL